MNTKAFSLALALSAAGCVYPAERGKMMEQRVDQLEADRTAMTASIVAQREELNSQLPIIKEALEKLEGISRRTSADTGVQVDELQQVIASLRGQLEEQTNKVAMLETALQELKAKSEAQEAELLAVKQQGAQNLAASQALASAASSPSDGPSAAQSGSPEPEAAALPSDAWAEKPSATPAKGNGAGEKAASDAQAGREAAPSAQKDAQKNAPPQQAQGGAKAQAPEAAKNPPAAVPPAPPVPDKPVDKSNPKAFADGVVEKLKSDPEAGRKLAEEFLRKYRKHEQSARVHYEVGASLLSEKNYRAALAEFGVFIQPDTPKAFTDSKWAPMAVLKSADCFAALKMNNEANMALEEVAAGYPRSPEAKVARARLDAQKKPSAAEGKKSGSSSKGGKSKTKAKAKKK